MNGCIRPAHRRRRMGLSSGRLLAALAVMGILAFGGWRYFAKKTMPAGLPDPITVKVEVGEFLHEVVERGEVESSNSVEIRCEVASRSTSGTTILEIVDEGAYVEKGDFLARLDDSSLQTELLQQQIVCNSSDAQVIQAQADVAAAKLALEEYESGIFAQEEETLESTELVAKENMRRAEEYLAFSKRLAERGYVSSVQLEADKFAVEKAKKELEVAEKKLEVLRTFTKQRMTNKLRADIATAEAQLRSKENSYKLDRARLELVQQQIEKCRILAPAAGQVVYAKETRSLDHVVGEGLSVRDRQVMFTLPDPKRMRVRAKVHESRIEHVKPELRVQIRLDAFPDLRLVGIVRGVSDYPLPSSSIYTAHIKEYAVEVEVVDPPATLRPGLTAEVAIRISHQNDALLVPIFSIVNRAGQQFCLVREESGELAPREVKVGATNEQHAVIERGLRVGDVVVVDPKPFEEHMKLPMSNNLETPAKSVAVESSPSDLSVAPTSADDKKPSAKKARLARGIEKDSALNATPPGKS